MDCYQGQSPNEEDKQEEEEPNGDDKGCPVPDGGVIHVPGRGHVVPVQAGHHDDEAFQPHAHVYKHRHNKKPHCTGAAGFYPE